MIYKSIVDWELNLNYSERKKAMNETKSVVLRCKKMCANVDLTRGATCTSFYDEENGINVLYSSDNRYLNGMPILFPANRISGGTFTLDGYKYTLPITEAKSGCSLHGEMNLLPFEVMSQSENEVCCRRECHGDYFCFPQHFCVDITYKLTENALTQNLRVTNHSDIPLPLLFGFHTTFAIPFCRHSSADDIRVCADIDLEVERGADCLPIAVRPATDRFSEALQKGTAKIPKTVSCHYRAGKKGDMLLFDTRTGVVVHYEPSVAFRYRMIYTADREKYLCLEPQISVTNAPNAPLDKEYTHIPVLSQGETAEYQSKISLYVTEKVDA